MRGLISKIAEDTLKAPNGKFSRKSLTVFVSFSFCMTLGFYIAICDIFLDKELNRYAIDVFDALLIFVASLMGIAEASKKLENKTKNNQEHEA